MIAREEKISAHVDYFPRLFNIFLGHIRIMMLICIASVWWSQREGLMDADSVHLTPLLKRVTETLTIASM